MNSQSLPKTMNPRVRLLLTIALIVVGLAIIGVFGVRSVRSFNQLQYARQQGLDNGTASVDAIRPWMTIRFIAVAYAVPEEYLYSALNIPFDARKADQSLGELNRIYDLGLVPGGTELVIIDKARTAITEYRKNPVVTGLRDIRTWMSIRYIANSTGVTESELFAIIGIPADGNSNKPLELLAKEHSSPDGPRAMTENLQKALSERKTTP